MPRLSLAFAVLLAGLAAAPIASAADRSRVDGPLRPKAAIAKPVAAAPPRRGAETWTETPDGRRQWRDGATTVTVSGSVTVDMIVQSRNR